MKRILTLLTAMLCVLSLHAYTPEVRDLNVRVHIYHDGSVLVNERWDVCVASGTEWYLNRENLGDIEIRKFFVKENGKLFTDTGEWDVNGTIDTKAGKSGIVHKSNGVELCWGVGSYGDHVFDVTYVMLNTVKSLIDYDMFHVQLVSDQLSSAPKHVKVTIETPDYQLDTTCCRAWGFGYKGQLEFDNGKIVLESTQPFDYNSSVIAMVRFDKGMIESSSVQDRYFQDALDVALEGAYFGDKDDEELGFFESLLGLGLLYLLFIRPLLKVLTPDTKVTKAEKKRMLGVDPSKIDWCRDEPMDGSLLMADYVLYKLGERRQSNALASATILRFVQKGVLIVVKDDRNRVSLAFSGNPHKEDMLKYEKDLYDMMVEASGSDRILQQSEFSVWATSHRTKLRSWATSNESEARSGLTMRQWFERGKFTELGKAENRKLLGFKKFLTDFTLIKERTTVEVALWREYLVFAALFGVADKVAKELKDIAPDVFREMMNMDYATLNSVVSLSHRLATSITSAQTYSSSSGGSGSYGSFSSYSGSGGHSSYGGGGGFSGGGHGGGSR